MSGFDFPGYPLLFSPLLKPRVWGGRRLLQLGKSLPPNERIGESWEIADLSGPPETKRGAANRRCDGSGNRTKEEESRTPIINGPLARQTLGDVLESDARWLMGDCAFQATAGFPLLIKFLDAAENLSIQVHPSPEYAAAHPDAHLKCEAWIVIDHEPDAVIYRGLKPDVTPETLTRHLADGSIKDDLIAVPARCGDCHYLPSGTCHALGAGVLVAEVQTPSDTTFRLYDWGRTGKHARELHIEQALACIRFGDPVESSAPVAPGPPVIHDHMTTRNLLESDHFTIDRIEVERPHELRISTSNQPIIWMVLRGAGLIRTDGFPPVEFTAGTTVLLPASVREAWAQFIAPAQILRVKLPSPTRGMIAGSNI